MSKKRKEIHRNIGAHVAKRHKAEKRFRIYGICAIATSFIFLAVLMFNIISEGSKAFYQTRILLPITFDETIVDPTSSRDPEKIRKANFIKLARNALLDIFPDVESRRDKYMLYQLVSKSSALELRDLLLEDLSLIGKTQQVWLLASSDVDMYLKGKFPKDTPEHRRKLKDKQLEWVHALKGYHSIKYRFNKYFFTSGDSRSPEIAGILGSIMGSFFIVVVCMLVAFPIGVLSAIYLEEFAPKNRLTEFIEININNLAAVPSIVFGLLGLSIYIQVFGLPRSASFVGGLTLALMALPVIVISTRTAIRAIPQSIKDGAIALGASKMQTTLHHVLPLAMPGIMTGSILSVARILGETAPLLMIGMVAFIVDIPQNWFDAATAMPVQIYLWADSPESGFVEKTSAAILVLLVMLAAINAIAVIVRKKFEKRW